MNATYQTAHEAGYSDAMNGVRYSQNPYIETSVEFGEWNDGYGDAEDEIQNRGIGEDR